MSGLHAETREGGADLTPMIGAVVQRLRELDTHRVVPLVPVVIVHLFQDGARIDVAREELRPGGPVALHGRTELRQTHVFFVDDERAITVRDEQVPRVRPDDVAFGLEDRAVRAGNRGVQLLWAEREACIDQHDRRPHVVSERVLQQRSVHLRTVPDDRPGVGCRPCPTGT